jgi:hypothetical protein
MAHFTAFGYSLLGRKGRGMKITEQCNPQAWEDLEATILEKTGVSLSQIQPRFEYFEFPPSRGFWSKAPLRLRYARPKPSLTMAEFQQICQVAGRWLADRRKAEGKNQVLLKDPIDINQLRAYRYRKPWLPQLRDDRKHPILARIFRYFWNLPLKFDPPWKHLELIITRKTAEKKGGAA